MEFTSDPEDLAERPQQKRRGRNYRKSRRSYEPVNAEGERVDFQGRVSDDDFEDIPLREEDESARYADEDYDVYTRETEQAYEDEEDYEEEGVDAANRIFKSLRITGTGWWRTKMRSCPTRIMPRRRPILKRSFPATPCESFSEPFLPA
jgi:hypothetical protein